MGPYRIQNITRRLKENKINCTYCKEECSEKRTLQSEFMKQNASKIVKNEFLKEPKITKTCKDIINESNKLFEELDTSEKEIYFNNHFLASDYFLSFIKSVNGIDISELTYFEHILITNTKFFPRFYNEKEDIFIKLENILFNCIICDTESQTRQLSGVRNGESNKCNFKCKYCYLVTEKFCIKQCKNIKGKKITYQSKLEDDFVQFCNSNNILVEDGPILLYEFENKTHKYKTDFYLPNHSIVLELKDNHIWHKRQVESGKWEKKEQYASKFCEENNIKYKLVFPNMLDKFKTYLIRYSPTSGESQRSKV